jgi:hypothetical protein
VIGIQVKDSSEQFTKCPNFLNPFVLKWAHESDFTPKDIEPDIPRRLDLCYCLKTKPDKLIFFTLRKADGNKTIYPPGTYKVKVRVDSENAQTVDGEFEIQFGNSWNDIQVTTIDEVKNEQYSQGAQKKARRITPWLGLAAALITLLAAVITLWNPFTKKTISRTSNKTKISAKAKTGGDSSPAIITSVPNSPVIVNYDSPESKTKQIAENKFALSPKEIFEDIDSRPVFQQKDAWKYYIGLKVKWRLCLISISMLDEKNSRCPYECRRNHWQKNFLLS